MKRNIPSPSAGTETNSAEAVIPIVLVHGIWNTAAIFNPLKVFLESAGWPVYTFSMTPNNGDAPIEYLAEQTASFIDRTLDSQQPFNIVGFSMGGLVGRYYVQRLGGIHRVKTFVTVSAPHQGTALAFGSYRLGVKQMRPGSAFLTDLNRDAYRLGDLRFFSFWTPFDLLILPPWSSYLGIGKTQRLSVPSHNRMIRDFSGLAAIASALQS
ncbi:MAG: alpha/beta fold hydrolase [Cyanobacteria bacterium J06649_4]